MRERSPAYDDRARLSLLAALVVDYFDEEFGGQEPDEGDERCAIYNAAYAVLERETAGGESFMDELLREHAEWASRWDQRSHSARVAA